MANNKIDKCCVVPFPIEKCGADYATGGISSIVFASCRVKFNDIKDPVEWCTYVHKGDIVVTNEVMGKKDKSAFNTKMVSACRPEVTVGKTNTIAYTDFNLDTINYKDYDFYNTIQKNIRNYKVGYIKCDGSFTGFIDGLSIKVDPVIEDTVNGSTFWDVELSWFGLENIAPVMIPGLMEYLKGDCRDVANFQICDIYDHIQGNSLWATYTGANPNDISTLDICSTGIININAPFLLDGTYIYGRYTVDGSGKINLLPGPIAISADNFLIDYQPGQINTFDGYYVAIYDPNCVNGDPTTLDMFQAGVGAGLGVPYINAVFFYSIPVDTRPLFQPVGPGNDVITLTSVGPYYINGYGIEVVDFTVNVNPNFPVVSLEYQLQINGVPSNWQDSNIFTNVIHGTHTLLIRSKLNGCINQVVLGL